MYAVNQINRAERPFAPTALPDAAEPAGGVADEDVPRRRRSRWWLVGALLLVAAAGAVGYHVAFGEAPPSYRTAEVALGDIETTVTALGNLQPKDYVDVGAQISGQLEKLHVDIGDVVENGELLAEIDGTRYEAQVRADQANIGSLNAQILQQNANLELARSTHARNQRLYDARAVSQEEVESSAAALKVAEAELNSLHAQLDEAQSQLDGDVANLGYTKIYAPMAGTIVTKDAVEGQTLNANQTAPTIVRIANLRTMTVWAQVAEADVVKVRPGMPAYFTTLGLPERRWQGTVRQVLPTPEIVNDVVLYDVLIDVDNADGVLMTEMTAQVFFVLGSAEDVPLVPYAALRPLADGAAGEYTADVMTARGLETRVVTIGLSTRSVAQVVSGLAVGDEVVTSVVAADSATADAGRMRLPGL
jgi:macrolide-specific efflux system membrane fusion protein